MSMTASGDAFVAVQTTAISNVWVAPGGGCGCRLGHHAEQDDVRRH